MSRTASADVRLLEATEPRGSTTASKDWHMPDIMHLIKIHASFERAYQALATAEGIRNWWTHDPELDSKIGGTAEFHFYYEDQRATRARVHELKPPVRVGWMVLSSFRPEWEGRFQRRQRKAQQFSPTAGWCRPCAVRTRGSLGRERASGWASGAISRHGLRSAFRSQRSDSNESCSYETWLASTRW
jgi:hypothetical protein